MAHFVQSDSAYAPSVTDRRAIAAWLIGVAILLFAMVLVGGATRLTDSGLSITEWKPVTGAIPPMDESAWMAEFEKYKRIPEYQEVNRGMSLDEFKRIYWWEWGHRFLGRVIGIAFFAPFLYFLFAGKLNRALTWRLGVMFVLGGAQGALGWFMVKSGLVERVDVSQYRLAAHLGLAFLILGFVLWTIADLLAPPVARAHRRMSLAGAMAWMALGLVYVQIILGAFVAGLRAGLTYNTWPLMDGRFVPEGYFRDAPRFGDAFETIAAVQFNHRLTGILVVGFITAFFFMLRNMRLPGRALITPGLLFAAALGQFLLGVWTVIAAAPISLGLAHQAGALVLFTLAVLCVHEIRRYQLGPKAAL